MKENLWDTGLGKTFLDLTPKAHSINSDKFDPIKINNYCSAKSPHEDKKIQS